MPTNPTEQVDAVVEARELVPYLEGLAAGLTSTTLSKAAILCGRVITSAPPNVRIL